MATSEYVASRMSMANPNDAWIFEWNLVRLGPSTAADVTGVMVPPSSLSPRECAPLTQTLFFEAGFRFRNLILGWFQARGSQVDSIFVRAVTQDLQQLLAVELLEWRDLTSGVSFRIVPALSIQAPGDDVKLEESMMDVAMTDYKAGLFGRECLHQMRMVGVRPIRSPASSALGKPESKRPQYDPPRPPSIPSPSSHLPFRSSAQAIQDADSSSDRMSVTPSVASRRTQDRESSLFGTTIADSDESNLSGVSGSRSSRRYSSSSSSMWSFEGAPAGAHALCRYDRKGHNGSRYNGSRCLPSGPSSGGNYNPGATSVGRPSRCRYVGVRSDCGRSGHLSRTSHRLHRSRKSSPSEALSDSVTDSEGRRNRRSLKHHSRSSKRQSKSKNAPIPLGQV
ncbi:unnamed protein product [Phytophthora fragariaefolia]|uniref:Unnamed protein product n=1 Tax=Phytophthora fragariaefolia TaxID=1490495 RepID=A0A9W6XR37_9STRA|nr:unnamed protein product [Phytophthora fragariaefolia]